MRQLLQRALFIWKNREYHTVVLNRLREERNELVHAGSQSHRGKELVDLLLTYVTEFLYFLIVENHGCKNPGEIKEFFELSPDIASLYESEKILTKKITRIKCARSLFEKAKP